MIEALKKLNGQFFWHSILFFICAFSNNGGATQAKLTMKSNNLKHFLWKVFLKRTVAAVSYCRRQLHYYSSLPLLAFPYFSLYLLLVIIKKCWSTNRKNIPLNKLCRTNNWKTISWRIKLFFFNLSLLISPESLVWLAGFHLLFAVEIESVQW